MSRLNHLTLAPKSAGPRSSGSPDRRTRLLLQVLEGRSLPATFTVTTVADNFDPGTLRQCITAANGTPEADTIVFNTNAGAGTDFSVPRTITMSISNFAISRPLTIVGPGADKLTISGNNSGRIFNIGDATTAVIDVTLSGMTLTNGRVTNGDGGAIAIGNENVTILDSTITNSSVTSSPSNSGGGIAVGANGALTVRNSTISGNTSSGRGGGIYFYGDGSLLLENSTVSGSTQTAANFGGGGIYFSGTVTAGGFTIRNCTISGNSASNGGGLYFSKFSGNALIQNSTITNNTATTTETGAGEVGGGIGKSFGAGTITLTSSIVAGNFAPNSVATKRADISLDGAGLLTATNSAIGIDPGISAFNLNSGFNLTFGATLNLQPLANNGGPTRTHALGAGSAAIDKGSNPANLTTDQRGTGFSRVGGLTDIGAVEAGTAGIPVATLNPTTIVTAIGGTTYSFQVTYTDVVGINVGTLDGNDVRVSGPGFNSLAAFAGVTPSGNGTPRTATYTIVPPGGAWTAGNAGSYTIAIEPGQVLSTAGTPVAAGSIGTFQVATPTTFTVLNANDAGAGSLRQAILDSNARTGSADTIAFDSAFFATPRTINLTGQLSIQGSVAINGPGMNLLTVRRDPAAVSSFRIFEVNESGLHDVTIASMTIAGGNPTAPGGNSTAGEGGGIFSNIENLTVLNVAITGNSAAEGGGMATGPGGGFLTVRGSTISGNSANGAFTVTGGGGGGIYIPYGGQLLVENSTISGNASMNGRGGGVYLYGYVEGDSAWTIRDSIVSNNTATRGAGIYGAAYDGDSLLIENTTISGNTSTDNGGGIYVYGAGNASLTFRNSTLASNTAPRGGGVFVTGASLLVQNSTLSGNSATAGRGGGVYFSTPTASLIVQNSTISGNTASISGGGISTVGTNLLIQNCTITNNQANSTSASQGGGGIIQSAGAAGVVTIVSSIVSGNTNAVGPDIRAFGLVNVNFSAIGSATGFTLSGTSGSNRPFGANLNLQPLATNGGPTQTIALGAGSAAIDTGSNPLNLSTDQRGPGFVRGSGQTDIGAFEVQGAMPPPRISGTQINGGAAQRSRVTSLTITFDAQVDFAGGNVGNSFTLTRNGSGVVGFTANASVVGGVSVVTLNNFTGVETQSGSLRDGRYTLAALASNISNAGGSLDGDGNGTPGDNFTFGDAQGLFRYYGDMNGDRRVDISDFGFFSLAFLQPANFNPALDFNNDGRIDIADFGQFSVRYFTTLP